ncbi:MAG: serine hydrolase domain-containing protein [Bacteroidota bacterium]
MKLGLLPALGLVLPTLLFAQPADLDAQVEAIMEEYHVTGVGIGRIEESRLAWTRYYGEQSPGVAVSDSTMFNTASVNKAVTAELALRLVDEGLLDFDEPISAHYVHPDIAADSRHEYLTPRIILTHTTGFLNWPHNYEDGKLAFLRDPGEAYGYSGIGFMILGRFLEHKLGTTFPELVRQHVFEPAGMTYASVVQAPWMEPLVAHPSDAEGQPFPDFALDYGYWNPADDLYVSVPDYAKFLLHVLEGNTLSPALRVERQRVQTSLIEDDIWGCKEGRDMPCPDAFGHSIGWFVFDYGGNVNIQHGGNDQGEAGIGYLELSSNSGTIVFVRGANGVLAWPRIVDLIDGEQQFTSVFHAIIAEYFSAQEEG